MTHSNSSFFISRTKCASLALAILLAGLPQSHAASSPGTLIGSGQVTGGPSPALPDQVDSVSLQYSLHRQPDGTPSGNATLTSADGSVDFDLTTYILTSEGTLSAAGPATAVSGSPAFGPDSEGPTPHIVELGETLFFSVLDNRSHGVPDAFLEGKVPSFLPPELIEQSRTIRDILAAVPPAPASIYRQVHSGDLSIANPPGTLIGSGKVTGGPSVAIPNQAASVSLQYSLSLNSDGTPNGQATLTSADGSVDFDLKSFVISPEGILSAAGPATGVSGSPAFGPDSEGPTPHIVELGETLFFSVLDDHGLGPNDAFLEGKVPSFLPPEVIEQSRTIQDILASVPPAPTAVFRQVETGDLSTSPPPGTLIANGNVTEGSGLSLQFSLYALSNGLPDGSATLSDEFGSVDFNLTSHHIDSNGTVSAAGPVTTVRGAPSFGPDANGPEPHIVEPGEIAFFSVRDTDASDGPDSFIEGKIQFYLPIEEYDTIQKIQGIIGEAPDHFYREVVSGDIIKFPAKRAKALALLQEGIVSGIQVTDSGSGYEAEPLVIISGDGTGATATATVTNGVITSITVTDPGSGYTAVPIVSIASPPFAPQLAIKFITPELPTEAGKVQVWLKIVLGHTYQLEHSHDLNNWFSTGEPFVAQNEELIKEFNIDTEGQFFRIQELP